VTPRGFKAVRSTQPKTGEPIRRSRKLNGCTPAAGAVSEQESRRSPEGYWAAQYPCGHLTGLGDLSGTATSRS